MKNLSILKFYAITIPVSVAIIFVIGFFLDFLATNTPAENPIDNYPKEIQYILGVLFAPIAETFLYQYLPLKTINYFGIFEDKKKRMYLIFAVSSLFFAISHPYSVAYVIYAFLIGLLFIALYYYSYEIRKDGGYAFLLIWIIHTMVNILATIGV